MSNVRPTHKDADVSPEELIRQAFGAYESNDRDMIEAVLARDLTFTSPQDDHIDRATYFERCWPNAAAFKSVTIERIFAEGDEAFATYVAEMKDGRRFRNTEFYKFNGPHICAITVYFGRTLGYGQD